MAARKKRTNSSRGFSLAGGFGNSFSWPSLGLSLDTSALTIYSDPGTAIGTFTPTPASATVELVSGGALFQLGSNGVALQAGTTPTTPANQPTATARAAVVWSGKRAEFDFPITLGDATTALSGSHSFAHLATQGTAIGDLSSTPSTGITYSIVTQDVVNGLQLGAPNHLQKGSGVVSAGAYSITIRATKGSNHWDTVFALTAT